MYDLCLCFDKLLLLFKILYFYFCVVCVGCGHGGHAHHVRAWFCDDASIEPASGQGRRIFKNFFFNTFLFYYYFFPNSDEKSLSCAWLFV